MRSTSTSRGEHLPPPHRQHGPLSRAQEPAYAAPMEYKPSASSLPRPLVDGYRGFASRATEHEVVTEDEAGSGGDDDGSSLQMEEFYFSGQGNEGAGRVDYEVDDMDIYLGPTNKSTMDISKIKHVSHPLFLGTADERLVHHQGDEGRSKMSQLSALERLQIHQRRVTQEQQRLANLVLPPSTAEEKRAVSGMLPTREMTIEAIPAYQQHELHRRREEAVMRSVSPPRPPERPFSPTPPSVASQQFSPPPPRPHAGPHDQPYPADSDAAKLDELLSSIPGLSRPKLPTQLEWQRNLAVLTTKQQEESTQPSSKTSRRQSHPTPREAQQLHQQQPPQDQAAHLKQPKKPYKLNAGGGLVWSLAHLEDDGSGDEDSKSRRHSMPEMLAPQIGSSLQQNSPTPELGQQQGRRNERLNFAHGVGVVRDNGNNQNKRRSGLEWVLQPDLVDGQPRSRPGSGIEGATFSSQDQGFAGDNQPRSSASKSTLSDKDALDQAFEDMLISLSISEAAREKLHQLQLSKDHKWAMIQANDAHPALYETPDTLPPTYFTEALYSYFPTTPTQANTVASGNENQVSTKVKQSRRHSSSASTSSALSAHDAILQNRKRSNSNTMGSPMQVAGVQSSSSSPPRPLSKALSQLLGGGKSEKRMLEEREQVLQNLRILLRNGSVRWSKEFFRVGGARALLEFSNHIASSEETKYGQKERLLYQSIQCIKSMVASDEGVSALKTENQFFPLLRKLVLLDYTLSSPSVLIRDKQGRPQSPAFSRPMSPTAMFYSATSNNSSSKLSLRPTSPTPKGQPMGRTRSRSGSIPKPLSTLSLIPVGGSMVNLHTSTGINLDKQFTTGHQNQNQQQQRPAVAMAEMFLSGLSNIQGALTILLNLLSKSPELKETILRETVANPGGSNARPKSPLPHGSSHHGSPHHSQHTGGMEASPTVQVRRGSLTTSGPALFGHLSFTEWVAHLNKMIQICERDQQARQELKIQHQLALEAYRPRSPASANGYFYQRRRQTATGAEGLGKTSTLLGFTQGGSPPGAGGGLTKILGLRRATSPSPTAFTPPSSPSSAMFQWESRRRRNSATTEDGLRVLGDVATLAASAAAAGAGASLGSDQVGEGRELLACLMLHLDFAKILMQDMGGPSSLSIGFAKSVKDGRVDESLERLKSYLDATQTFTAMIQETLHLISLVPPYTTRRNASSLIRNHSERSQQPMPMSFSSPPLDKRRHPSDDSHHSHHHHGHHPSSSAATSSSPSPSPTQTNPAHHRLPSTASHYGSGMNEPAKTRKTALTQSAEVAPRSSSPSNPPRRSASKTEKPKILTQAPVRPSTKETANSTARLSTPTSLIPPPLNTRGYNTQLSSRNTPSPLGQRMRKSRGEDVAEEEAPSPSSVPSPSSPRSPRSPVSASDISQWPSRQPSQRHNASGSTTTMLPVPTKSPRRPSVDTASQGSQLDHSPTAASTERKRSAATSSRLNNISSSSTKSSSHSNSGNNHHPRHSSSSTSSSSGSNPAESCADVAIVPEKNPARKLGRLDSVSEGISLASVEEAKTKDLRGATSKAAKHHGPNVSRTSSTLIPTSTRAPLRATSPTSHKPSQRSLVVEAAASTTTTAAAAAAAATAATAAATAAVPRSPTMSDLGQYALSPNMNTVPANLESEALPVGAPRPRSRATSPVGNGGHHHPPSTMLRPRYYQHLQSLSEASSAGSTSLGSSNGSHFRRGQTSSSSFFQEPSTDSSILSTASSVSGDTKDHRELEKEKHVGLKEGKQEQQQQELDSQGKQRVETLEGPEMMMTALDRQEPVVVVEFLAVGDLPVQHDLPAPQPSNATNTATTASPLEPNPPLHTSGPEANIVQVPVTTTATKKSVTLVTSATPTGSFKKTSSMALVGDMKTKKEGAGQSEKRGDEDEDEQASPIDFDAHIHDNVRLLAASSSTSNLLHGSSFPSSSSPSTSTSSSSLPSLTTSAAAIRRSMTPTTESSKQQRPHQFLRSSTSSQLLTTSSSSSSSSTSPPTARSASRPTSLYVTSTSSTSFSASQQQQLLLSAKSDADPKILSAPIIVPDNMTRVHAQYLQSQLSQIVLPPLEDSKTTMMTTTKGHSDQVHGGDHLLQPSPSNPPSNRSSIASAVSTGSSNNSYKHNRHGAVVAAVEGSQDENQKKMSIAGLSDRIRR
ncbi:hypothetical protein DFQ26_000002 [Actinomortierella ambigua]|nr:hypothetical protein DFQ26_000002 [Actinomortierella ambigua]